MTVATLTYKTKTNMDLSWCVQALDENVKTQRWEIFGAGGTGDEQTNVRTRFTNNMMTAYIAELHALA